MNEVKMIEDLYMGTEDEAMEAINNKNMWIEKKYYIPGDESFIIDKNGEKHFPFIESLFNNVLLFKNIDFSNSNFTKEECSLINAKSKGIAAIDLFENSNFSRKYNFYVEYNFSRIELSAYHEFVANIFHKIPFGLLNINKSKISDGGCDLIKSLVVGKSGESILIISKDKLQNMCYDCHILSKIVYQKGIDRELIKSLYEIANKNDIEIEEIDEN